MVDTIGEQNLNYQTVDQKAKGPVTTSPVKSKSFMSSVAAFAVSLGILGGTVTGHDTTTPIIDTAVDAKNVTADFGQGAKDRVDAMNNSIKYGSPIKPNEAPKSTPTTPLEVKR